MGEKRDRLCINLVMQSLAAVYIVRSGMETRRVCIRLNKIWKDEKKGELRRDVVHIFVDFNNGNAILLLRMKGSPISLLVC